MAHLNRGKFPSGHGFQRATLSTPRKSDDFNVHARGPSHVDLFDPKPELQKYHGKEYTGNVAYSFVGRANKSSWQARLNSLSMANLELNFPNSYHIPA